MRLVPAQQPAGRHRTADSRAARGPNVPRRRPTPTPAPPVPVPAGSGPSEANRTVRRAPVVTPSGPPSGWVLTFDTGERVAVDGLVLVGRRPEGRPGETVRRLVALPSQGHVALEDARPGRGGR